MESCSVLNDSFKYVTGSLYFVINRIYVAINPRKYHCDITVYFYIGNVNEKGIFQFIITEIQPVIIAFNVNLQIQFSILRPTTSNAFT